MSDDIVGAHEPKPPGDGSSGWYPDPVDPQLFRSWDGAMWTERTASAALLAPADTEMRFVWSTMLWGAGGLVCSLLPIASWLAVFVCGPWALISARRNRRMAQESGLPPDPWARIGVRLGIAGMVIGVITSIVYLIYWPTFVGWLNSG